MIPQYEIWTYLHGRFKRTDMVAKKFELSVEQARHVLQKLTEYGHAKKERRGLYSYWKAIEDSPPRRKANTQSEKDDRREEVYMHMVFTGVVYRDYLKRKTGFSDWVVLQCLKSLEADGHVVKVGTKGWRAIR